MEPVARDGSFGEVFDFEAKIKVAELSPCSTHFQSTVTQHTELVILTTIKYSIHMNKRLT